MSEYIGVEALTISHSKGSTTSGGSFSITSPPSTKVRSQTKSIYKGTLAFSFSGGSSSETLGSTGVVTPETVYGAGTIDPTATKVKSETQLVIRENDAGAFTTLFGTFVPTSTGTPVPNTPLPPTNVEITSANQVVVKAE